MQLLHSVQVQVSLFVTNRRTRLRNRVPLRNMHPVAATGIESVLICCIQTDKYATLKRTSIFVMWQVNVIQTRVQQYCFCCINKSREWHAFIAMAQFMLSGPAYSYPLSNNSSAMAWHGIELLIHDC